ncbi:TPA: hypothetical protein ROX84_005238 [Bacillus thuringiensis]|nr:hypothetical protein [Bacillus thuringiensis]
MFNKKIFFIALGALILLISVSILFKMDRNKPISDSEDSYHRPGMTEGSNTLQIGLLDTEGKLIDGGSRLNIENSKLSYTISFDSFIPEEREYMLIILADFVQTPFYVNENQNETLSYTFKAKANESINIPTSIETANEAKEIIYLIVKKPHDLFKPQKVDSEVIDTATSLEQIVSLRFNLTGKTTKINYSKDFQQNSGGPLIETFLSKDPKELRPIFQLKGKEKIYLTVGNTLDYDMDVAIVQFLDWKQLPFSEGEKTQYINVPAKKAYSKEIELPIVSKESNFQTFIFYKPYSVSPSDFESQLTFGTYRLVVTP